MVESCKSWVHADCINAPGEVVNGINGRKRIRFDCDSCGSNDNSQKERKKEIMETRHKLETQDDVMHKKYRLAK